MPYAMTSKITPEFIMPNLSDYMTTEEAAELLGFNVQSVRRFVRNGNLESIRVGRTILILKKSLEDYIKKNTGFSKNDPRRKSN